MGSSVRYINYGLNKVIYLLKKNTLLEPHIFLRVHRGKGRKWKSCTPLAFLWRFLQIRRRAEEAAHVATNRIFGHGSTRPLFKQVWGINHDLHHPPRAHTQMHNTLNHIHTPEEAAAKKGPN